MNPLSTGLERLERSFARIRGVRAALITYLCAGDPSPEIAKYLFEEIQNEEADIIEVGLPFSDPSADGPVIQAASARALRSGQNTVMTLDLIAGLHRRRPDIPIVAMGYLNPLLTYGLETFCANAATAGVSGLIIVDLPLEEQHIILPYCQQNKLALIQIVAPTSSSQRIQAIMQTAQGFVYVVGVKGVTGKQPVNLPTVHSTVKRLKTYGHTPVAVGFGVTTPQQVHDVANSCDAVVVGSALIRAVTEHHANGKRSMIQALSARFRALRQALPETNQPKA